MPTALQTGVIAFYPFNDGSLLDAAGGNHDLANVNGAAPAEDRNGNVDCAYAFDERRGQYLTTTRSAHLDGLSSFSVALWYQPRDSSRRGGLYEVLYGRGQTQRCPDRRGEWSLGLFDCRKAVFGHDNSVWVDPMGPAIDPTQGYCEAVVAALTGEWHHVVAVKELDEYRIYWDGVLQRAVRGPAGCSDQYTAQDIGDVFVGAGYTGVIDDILVYDRALTQAEVTALFEVEPCCTGAL